MRREAVDRARRAFAADLFHGVFLSLCGLLVALLAGLSGEVAPFLYMLGGALLGLGVSIGVDAWASYKQARRVEWLLNGDEPTEEAEEHA